MFIPFRNYIHKRIVPCLLLYLLKWYFLTEMSVFYHKREWYTYCIVECCILTICRGKSTQIFTLLDIKTEHNTIHCLHESNVFVSYFPRDVFINFNSNKSLQGKNKRNKNLFITAYFDFFFFFIKCETKTVILEKSCFFKTVVACEIYFRSFIIKIYNLIDLFHNRA